MRSGRTGSRRAGKGRESLVALVPPPSLLLLLASLDIRNPPSLSARGRTRREPPRKPWLSNADNARAQRSARVVGRTGREGRLTLQRW